jgi:hypothetical protein
MPARLSPVFGALRIAPLVVVPMVMVAAAGCSLANDGVSGLTAPVGALPATDVAIESNLKTSLTFLDTALAAGGGMSGVAGPGFVTGPSTGPSETSFAALGSSGAVIAEYNDVTRDCLGIVDAVGVLGNPVLGVTGPGTFYFLQRSTSWV